MTDRFPLIINSEDQQIQELSSGDKLDLTGSGVVADVFTVDTNSQERLRLDSLGRLLVGTSSAQGNYTLQIQGDGLGSTAAGSIYLRRGLNTSQIGGNVGAELGDIQFGANDGTISARIECLSDAAWSSTSDTPGRLVFFTTASGESSPTERMRIDSSGNMGLGTITLGSNAKFEVKSTTGAINSATIRINGGETTTGAINTGSTLLFTGHDGSNERDFGSVFAGKENGTSGNRASYLAFGTRPNAGSVTERMRLDSDGNVGIGTTSVGHKLDLLVSGGADGVNVYNNATGAAYYQLATTSRSYKIEAIGSDLRFYDNTGSAERLRIDSAGRLLVGTSSASLTNKFLLQGDTNSASNGGYMRLQTDNSIVAGTSLGSIGFGDSAYNGALIEARGDVSWSPFTKGSRLEFSTTADGESSPTERMRIDSAGRLGLGVVPTAYGGNSLEIHSASSVNSFLALTNSTTGTGVANGFNIIMSNSEARLFNREAGDMTFWTSSTERLKIDNAGAIFVGNSSSTFNIIANSNSAAAMHLSGGGGGSANIDLHGSTHSSDARTITFDTNNSERMRITSAGQIFMNCTSQIGGGYVQHLKMNSGTGGIAIQNYGSSNTAVVFRNSANNASVGSITTSNTATSYIESSDYRLKENVVDITDGITRVKQLQPRRFNFIADADTTVDGFLAHEAQTVVPEAVIGTKDEVDDEGNAVMQGIDKSKLVPLLTAALQEAIAKIETLEQRLSDAGIA